MNKADNSNRWFSAWRSAPRPQEQDPADMGTAFGLDLSLNLLHPEQLPPAPSAPAASWVSRLALRRKSAL